MCASCYDKWLKSTNPTYKKAQISNTTRWCNKNPEKWKIIKDRRKAKDKLDPNFRDRKRNYALKLAYGISLEDYNALLILQNNSCALCFRKQGKTKLHTDHDHITDKVRGLLCHQCNWYLGTIDSDISIIDRIIKYLGIDDRFKQE